MITPKEFRAVRQRVGLTQVEAAKLGNVSWMTLMRYEGGRILRMYPKTAQGLQRVYDAMITMPSRPPRHRGRGLGVRNKLPANYVSSREKADRELTEWSKLHDQPNRRGGQHNPKKEPPAFHGHDRAWLELQVKNWLRAESLGVVARDKCAYFVLSGDSVLDLCQKVIAATGGKLR